MDRRERSGLRIAEQNRNTVSRLDANQYSAKIRDQSVELLVGHFDVACRCNLLDGVAVNLPDGREAEVIAEHGKEWASILCVVGRRIFIESRKIQIVRRERRYAAEPRRKTIRESGPLERTAN